MKNKRISGVVIFVVGTLILCLITISIEDNKRNALPTPTKTPPRYKVVTEAGYGEEHWPFTISQGQIECWGDDVMLFTSSEGKFALNGWSTSNYGYTSLKKSGIIKESHITYGAFSQDYINFVREGIDYCLNR